MAKLSYQFEEGTSAKGIKSFVRGPICLGIALLTAVNCLLLIFSPLAKVDPDSLPAAHTWVWWATQEFLAQNKAPDVVLLGSSLLMHPVSREDADFLCRDVDYVKHHRSNYLEYQLFRRGIDDTICYNFALPGGMVSDDYMVTRALLLKHKPAIIVLGLSLRDFIDNGVHCAGATPAFKYLKRFTSVDDIADISMPQIWQKFDFVFGKAVYLWGKKLDLQVVLAQQTKQLLSPYFQRWFAPSALAAADPARNQPSNLRAEVEEGMMIVQHNQPYSYEDNSAEYQKRYRSPNDKGVAVQNFFYDKLLQLANQNNIKVLIVNMPLTASNHNLMPRGSYEKYLAFLQAKSARYHCTFVNLDDGHTFEKSNYYDTAHMNSSGGKKLIDMLACELTEQTELANALKQADHTAVASEHQPL
jgi:hypothetical protein